MRLGPFSESKKLKLTDFRSIVVDHLRRQLQQKKVEGYTGVAVIYLKYNEPDQTVGNLLASLLKQLAQQRKELPSVLVDLYERYNDQSVSASLDDIFETLLLLIKTYTEVYFIVDALDECSDELRWDLVEKLRACTFKARLMITSRFLENINEELDDFSRLIKSLHYSFK